MILSELTFHSDTILDRLQYSRQANHINTIVSQTSLLLRKSHTLSCRRHPPDDFCTVTSKLLNPGQVVSYLQSIIVSTSEYDKHRKELVYCSRKDETMALWRIDASVAGTRECSEGWFHRGPEIRPSAFVGNGDSPTK
jgi:hypothetical protein